MGINKKSEDYKQGLIDGFKKGQESTIKIYKEGEKTMKPIREALNKLRRLRS